MTIINAPPQLLQLLPSLCCAECLRGQRSIQAMGATHILTISHSTLLCGTSSASRWLPMSLMIFTLCMRIHQLFCRRFINKHNDIGHCHAMLKTGNHKAERTVSGQSLVNLALFWVVFPAATIDEARAYLFNMGIQRKVHHFVQVQC